MAKTTKFRAPIEVDYALSIESWQFDYEFGVVGEKARSEQLYTDSRYLHVQGTLSHPRKSAGRQIDLAFVPDKELLEPIARLYQSRPKGVGSVVWSRNAKAFDGVLSIPESALLLIVPMLAGQQFLHLMLRSTSPFRGHLEVASYRFVHTLTADYFPEGEW